MLEFAKLPRLRESVWSGEKGKNSGSWIEIFILVIASMLLIVYEISVI